jgi:photosystem I subunit 10
LIHLSLLAAAEANLPSTTSWSPSVMLVMVACNILGVYIAAKTVKRPGVGTPMPIPGLADNFSVSQLVAGTCLGHIIGAGMILGLASGGAI